MKSLATSGIERSENQSRTAWQLPPAVRPLLGTRAAAALTLGNRVRVLRDGAQTLPAMFACIRAARRHVHLEYYVIEDVVCEGESLFDLLLRKRAAGVQVAVMFDSLGSSHTPEACLRRLATHGIELLAFNPLNPLGARQRYAPNHRDHRKILIADGVLAIVGGVNMSSTYERRPPGTAHCHLRRWRDTDLQLQGPSVARLQRLFLDHWSQHGGQPLADCGFFPPLAHSGQEMVAIIGSTPSGPGLHYYGELLTALRAARQRIWITAGYFLPTAAEAIELAHAAGRNVDVQLLLPAHNDSTASLAVQRSHYAALLDAGVRIFERDSVVLHSKSMVIDEAWSVVGSSNVDSRSVLFNDEVDAIIVGRDTADRLARLFRDDVAHAHEIKAGAWRARPATQKVQQAFWRLWQRLL